MKQADPKTPAGGVVTVVVCCIGTTVTNEAGWSQDKRWRCRDSCCLLYRNHCHQWSRLIPRPLLAVSWQRRKQVSGVTLASWRVRRVSCLTTIWRQMSHRAMERWVTRHHCVANASAVCSTLRFFTHRLWYMKLSYHRDSMRWRSLPLSRSTISVPTSSLYVISY